MKHIILLFIASMASLVFEADSSLQAELRYYLDRHNVQDEGYEMVAEYASAPHHGTRELPVRPLTPWSFGRWKGMPHREYGVERDSCSRMRIGLYNADTLFCGVRIDSAGVYSGDFSGGLADGHGSYFSDNGTYYEGQWQGDHRHGFGFSVAPFTHIRVGQWLKNRYIGERMHYTSERIYGIDISRYQHGKGAKKYGIDWKRLRITFLGSKNQKNAHGDVDYPVSFLFIKSTEGVQVKNPFFYSDYAEARRYGIPVGAYHFFSWRTSGAAQAQHFLSNTCFRKGDLPPVLDVEPSDAQIESMGGTETLFRQIRAWLTAVENHTGTKPILYVNQRFVNKYLDLEPDLKHGYPVWIARYGEYKPDVKLAFWQLSPEGHVSGIRGDVDINVFNGYQTQFEEFIRTSTIP